MAAILVIAFSAGQQRQASEPGVATDDLAAVRGPLAPGSEACRSARKAVTYYSRRLTKWSRKMGAARAGHHRLAVHYPRCPRYLARILRAKTYAARKAYERWVDYHWNWQAWLPDKWQRIGACETGYGRRPGNWRWNSGTYQGAFGFYYGTWDQYKPRGAPSDAYLATPRQQYQCALNVAAVHGYGAWGCGGA